MFNMREDYPEETRYKLVETKDGLEMFFEEGITDITEINFCNAFKNDKLEDVVRIHIPNSVTKIGAHAFEGFMSLMEVKLPPSVKTIERDAFCNCRFLESIELSPNLSGELPDSAFRGCRHLKTITIPEGITSIGVSAFLNCADLRSVHIPDTVTNIYPSAFEGCESLRSIMLPKYLEKIDSNCFKDCTMLREVGIQEHVNYLANSVFQNCTHLSKIHLPNSLKQISWSAFAGCSKLESLVIPSGVESVSFGVFISCFNLKSIEISNKINDIKAYDPIFSDRIQADIIIPLDQIPDRPVNTAHFRIEDMVIVVHPSMLENDEETKNLYNFIKDPSYETFVKLRYLENKIPLAVAFNDMDSRFRTYIKSHSVQAIQLAAKNEDFSIVDYLIDNNMLSPKMTDKCIELMEEGEYHQMFLMLISYKEKIGGFEKNNRFDL